MQGADPVSPGASLPQGRPSGVFRSTRRARLACRFFQTPRQGRACARRRAGRPGPPGFRSLGRWSGRELTWVPTVCLPPSRGERPGRSPEGDGGTASPECGPEAGATRRGRGLLGPARPSCRRPPAPASVTDEGGLRGLRAPTGMLCGGRALPSHSRGVCYFPQQGRPEGSAGRVLCRTWRRRGGAKSLASAPRVESACTFDIEKSFKKKQPFSDMRNKPGPLNLSWFVDLLLVIFMPFLVFSLGNITG